MKPKEPNPNDMENLSRAIVEAILGSQDVKQAMEKLNVSVDAFGKNFMVFVVNLDAVADFNKKDPNIVQGPAEEPKLRKRKTVKRDNLPDLVDGKEVSSNEEMFRDFIADRFDSDSWLKKLKLRLE
ncbi:MAG: hypothetical protein HY280_05005 [Nitrospinae bacterium]|nr:hypothetical protein [Nitrospinota bacterium]